MNFYDHESDPIFEAQNVLSSVNNVYQLMNYNVQGRELITHHEEMIDPIIIAHQQRGEAPVSHGKGFHLRLIPEHLEHTSIEERNRLSELSVKILLKDYGAELVQSYESDIISINDYRIVSLNVGGTPNGRNEFVRVTHQPNYEGLNRNATLYFDNPPANPTDVQAQTSVEEKSAGRIAKILGKFRDPRIVR